MIPNQGIPWPEQNIRNAGEGLTARGDQVSGAMLRVFAEVIGTLNCGKTTVLPRALKDLPLRTQKIPGAPFDAWKAWVAGYEEMCVTARTQEAALYSLAVLWEDYTPPPPADCAPVTGAP